MLHLLQEGEIENLINRAKETLLLLGVNLSTVVGRHSEAILKATRDRGVSTQIYLLDHQSQVGKDFYAEEGFRDHLRDSKAQTFLRLRETQMGLRTMQRTLADCGRGDRLKVWLYKYVCLYTAVAVDADTEAGTVLVSPHLYSVEAHHPLVELSRARDGELFTVYRQDLAQFIERVEKRPLPVE